MSTVDTKHLDLDLDDDTLTISIDPSVYTSTASITSPCTITTSVGSTCWPYQYTGGYSIGTGISATYTNPTVTIDTNGLTMESGTDIKIGDMKLSEVLTRLEERLNILHHNEALEDKWEELRILGNQYRELEKELLEKEKMWKILKDNS
jgi:hypothetical protein